MNVLLVGLGGTLGSLARFQVGKMLAQRPAPGIPLATFCVNALGALLLGLVSGSGIQGHALLFAADGFLGAFTTFSTFMYEDFSLFRDSKWKNALAYIAVTMAFGLVAYAAGFSIMHPAA